MPTMSMHTEEDDNKATMFVLALLRHDIKKSAWQLIRDHGYDREDLERLLDEAIDGERKW